MSPDIGIIGGADGPTAIITAPQFPMVTIIGVVAVVAVIAAVVIAAVVTATGGK